MASPFLVRLLSLGLVLSLTGCATLDREDCLTANWELIGFNDGVVGRSAERLEQHREACSEYGVVPQMEDYLQGYDRGTDRYCTAANGYKIARAGQAYTSACIADYYPGFERGFELGQEAFEQVDRVKRMTKTLQQLRKEQRADESEVSEKRDQLIADGISSDQRAGLLLDIDELQQQVARRSRQIKQQKHKVDMERRYLRQLEADLRQQL
ncbi:DUF2799 domain-containing protein [Amphritea japonica]|uniref:DUF2799 domain-containing protein n=1 Tax=Amphritea japonica ATCC BAA-1530 TaxID=1278309 RepID=A0A7R6SR30_9GAMM|nr:DUF2799 domain-containing protein [Amphritea japonica]BBB24751.1 conserved hypothetical protein [Amphritea japonica ATCC BAA-1530]